MLEVFSNLSTQNLGYVLDCSYADYWESSIVDELLSFSSQVQNIWLQTAGVPGKKCGIVPLVYAQLYLRHINF